jgi:hypothetical protein
MEEKEGGFKVGVVYDCKTGLPATPPNVQGAIQKQGVKELFDNRRRVERQLAQVLECTK